MADKTKGLEWGWWREKGSRNDASYTDAVGRGRGEVGGNYKTFTDLYRQISRLDMRLAKVELVLKKMEGIWKKTK
jgi:hypothetical protein